MPVDELMDEILVAFTEEAHELLDAMESDLLRLEGGERNPEIINAIFRAAHTIKGDAGIVDLSHIEKIAHLLEDYLVKLRSGEIEVSPPLVSLLLQGCDQIKASLTDVLGGNLEPAADLLQATEVLAVALCDLVSVSSTASIRVAPHSKESGALPSIQDLPHEPIKQDKIPLKDDALTTAAVEQGRVPLHVACDQRSLSSSEACHQEEVLVEQQMTSRERVDALPIFGQARKTVEARQIRVQAEKLDRLIDLVGELVISSAAAQLKAQKSGQADLAEANAGLVGLVENMRELSTQLRMVPIGEAFNRFRRAARDMARDMQLDIELVIRGEDTELDKSLVEKIGDPLMHLLRNALDHGIESADVRVASGKPAKGTIELNAYHETGGIVIEVSDDGAGLDREKILAKAVERGLLAAEQTLSDEEIFDLIFLPGFSTAETITSISGRGVGMDVVRNNIIALRGSVEVQSQAGKGTQFIFRLPLTMAIIDGFLVGVGKASYVIPLERVVECLELHHEDVDSHLLNLRGEVLPLLRLSEFFGQPVVRPERENVVVVKLGRGAAGIVVDVLHGEQQTVIKPMSSLFRHLRGIAGSTILGSGEVALILDVPSLLAMADHAGVRQYPP
jgi:two-component system chemotaxis sensor kinase CheA